MAHNAMLLAGSTALSPIGADVELISTCAAIIDLERAYDAPGFNHKSGTPECDAAALERERIVAEQDVLIERLCDLPCRTLSGVQAMAAALAAWGRELLKDGPAKDVGELITSHLVERLLALRAPITEIDGGVSQAADWFLSVHRPADFPDADLLAVCAEFRASGAAYSAIYDDDPDSTDEACAALANPIAESWDGMLNRMAELRATTVEGLAARAMVLAQHSGIRPGTENYPFAFEPDEPEDVTGRLLHMLLTDAVQMCAAPSPAPDADLLALRAEFDRLHALVVAYNKDLIPDGGSECADFDALCKRIAVAPSALTAEGRAFQAAAAMHHLYYPPERRAAGAQPGLAHAEGACRRRISGGRGAAMMRPGSLDVISDIRDQLCPCARWPDAELISASREYPGCDCIAVRAQASWPGDVIRKQNCSFPQTMNLPVKARVIGAFFADENGLRSAAVRSLADGRHRCGDGRATVMTYQNRAAAARLVRIEKALRNAESRLDAAIHRQDTRGEVSDVTPLHDQIRALVGEATRPSKFQLR